jgi:hypothetical protein
MNGPDQSAGTTLAVRPAPRARRRAIRLGLTQRGRLRRRIRFLRKQRELQLRDLGGLIFDMYRFGSTRQDLVREKLAPMFEADRELRAFEAMVGGRQPTLEVREPGVGGSCPRCLTLYSTDAHFCWRCGLALTEDAEAADVLDVDPGHDVSATEPTESEREPEPEPETHADEPSPNGAADEQRTTEIESGRLTSRPVDASRS